MHVINTINICRRVVEMKSQNLCVCILALSFLACAAPKNVVVLVPDENGVVGALEVTSHKGSVRLDEPGKALYIKKDGTLPDKATPIGKEELDSTFGEALAVSPEPPSRFILYFKFNSKELTEEGLASLEEAVAEINRRNSKDIIVTGHSDRVGERDYNVALSLQRAEMVKAQLTARGVAEEDIRATSHGEGNPLVATADNVPEPKNRRVEVLVR
jgi:outer membrane protein OmpA-like peptidoglycan-associated protein